MEGRSLDVAGVEAAELREERAHAGTAPVRTCGLKGLVPRVPTELPPVAVATARDQSDSAQHPQSSERLRVDGQCVEASHSTS